MLLNAKNSLLENIKNSILIISGKLQFKTKEDLNKVLYLEKNVEFTNLTTETTNGDIIDLSKIKFVVYGTRRASTVPQEHRKFNKNMVSTGSFEDTDGSILKFKILLNPKEKKLHANWIREKD